MYIISFNTNGIRAAIKKGLLAWVAQENADILCIQETKANSSDIDIVPFKEMGYTDYWFSAEKKGYSGVAVFTKQIPVNIHYGQENSASDIEGRVLRLDFENFTLINAYFPSGTSGGIRQAFKYQWLDNFQLYIDQLKTIKPKLIVVGDYNIAHSAIDIHDPKGNKNSSGFLPEERAWMDSFLASGWIDSFRQLYPTQTGAYTWWSQRFPMVRLQNKGWRIDYICLTDNLKEKIETVGMQPNVLLSDHCPTFIKLRF